MTETLLSHPTASHRVLLSGVVILWAAPALAQPTIPSFTIDSGGGVLTSGSIRLTSSIGQPDAATLTNGPSIRLEAGFLIPNPPSPVCRTDFNNDGFVEPGDLDEFITSYFSDFEAERARCDFNSDGFVEPGDLDEYITSYFEGC